MLNNISFNVALSLWMVLCSLSASSAAAGGLVQNLVLCEEVWCPELKCEKTIKLNGTCCPICVEPGLLITDNRFPQKTASQSFQLVIFADITPTSHQCEYNGQFVENGTTFHQPISEDSNATNSRSTATTGDYCNTCTCSVSL